MGVRWWVRGTALAAVLCLAAVAWTTPHRAAPRPRPQASTDSREPIQGSWHAREYRLASGPIHPVRGQIFFVDGRWQVVFFVLDREGTPRRGSAEGGSYALDGDRLTFMHEVNFSMGDELPGLPEAPLRMTLQSTDEAVPEAARAQVDGDRLTLYFPSGNVMTFVRAGALP